MFRSLFLNLLFIFAVSLGSLAQQTKYEAIVHDQKIRDYITYIPDRYDGTKPVAVVLNFHGFTSSALVQMGVGDFRPIADTAGFLIVHPQGLLYNGQSHWNVGGWTAGSTADDLGFVNNLLDTLIKEYNVDTSRIYTTGFSNGGFMSFLLSCQLSKRIAAMASVAGSMTTQTYDNCDPERPVPVLQIHGTNDFVVPYFGSPSTGKDIGVVLDYWVDQNNCSTDSIWRNIADIDTLDNSTVQHLSYKSCNKCVSVEHYKIQGGIHTWPTKLSGNRDINTSEIVWNFLNRYTLQGCVTGHSNTIEYPAIFVYPNPSGSSINISAAAPISNVRLITASGAVLYQGKAKEIEIRDFVKGLTIVEVETKTGTFYQKIMLR